MVPRCAGRRGGAQLGGGTSQDAEASCCGHPVFFFVFWGDFSASKTIEDGDISNRNGDLSSRIRNFSSKTWELNQEERW